MLHVFMDTMIYLHYRPLAEMDFKATFDEEEVTIQVARITIKELEGHKDSHSSNRLRDRSRNVLRFIEEAVTGSKVIKAGVYMEYCRINPIATLDKFDLDSLWGDDRLVATVYDFAQAHPEDTVVLVTADTGARLTCNHLGVTAFNLPDGYKLPAEQDEAEKEIKKLRAQIQRLETALPKLKFGLGSSQDNLMRFNFGAVQSGVSDEEIEKQLDDAMYAVPEITKPEPRASATNLSPLFAVMSMGVIPDEEYARYERQRARYREEYKKYIRQKLVRNARMAMSFQFELTISNIGTCPADDVDVWVHFPDGFVLCAFEDIDDEIGEELDEPSPPLRPQSLFDTMSLFAQGPSFNTGLYPGYYSGPVDVSVDRATVKKTNSYEVEKRFRKLKHGVSASFATLVVLYDSVEDIKSFNAEYRITVGNLPDAITGSLNFVLG